MDTSAADLLQAAGFRAGFVLGGIVALTCAAGFVLGDDQGRGRRLRPRIGGAFAAAVLAGFVQQSILDTGLLVGILALAGAAFLPVGDRPALRVAVTVPGAALVAASADLGLTSWETLAVLVVVVAGAPLVADVDRSYGSTGVLPLLLATTAAGIWATVPETQHAVVLAGVSVPLMALGWPAGRATLGARRAGPIVGLIAWTVAGDGTFRPASVVGGLACLGVLLLEPLVRRGRPPPEGWRVVALVLLHLGMVAMSSRVAGLRTSVPSALLIVAATYAVAAGLLAALRGQQAPRQ